jgi:hypothetical protein
MSGNEEKSNHLHPLQKLIVLHLARYGPQTKNKAANDIKHSYKPSHVAFATLEKKGFIRKGKMTEWRGRKFPLYWLTEEGVILALTEGASPTDLLTITKQVYPENQVLQFGLEMAPHFDLRIFKIALTALRTKGKLEPADLISIMITQVQTDAPMKTFIQALKTLRKHPKEYKQFKQNITQIQENFNKLTEIV